MKKLTITLAGIALAVTALVVGASQVPQCEFEDGSTDFGYQSVCVWTGGANRVGAHYVLVNGEKVVEW